jgi:hypothetical protein
MDISRVFSLDADRRTYLLSYLAGHLYAAGQFEQLFSLVDQAWMRLKFRVTGSHRSFVDDVEISKKASLNASPISRADYVQAVMLIAILRSYATRVPPEVLGEIAHRGNSERALAFADLIADVSARSAAYEMIADAEEELGNRDRAIELRLKGARLVEASATASKQTAGSTLLAAIQGGNRNALREYYRRVQYPKFTIRKAAPQTSHNEPIDLASIMALLDQSERAEQLQGAIERFESAHETRQLGNLLAAVLDDRTFAYRPELLGLVGCSLVTLGEYEKAWLAANSLNPDTARDLVLADVDEQTAGMYAMDFGFAIRRLEARMQSAQEAVANGLMVALLKDASNEAIENAITAAEEPSSATDTADDMLQVVSALKGTLIPIRRARERRSSALDHTLGQIAVSLALTDYSASKNIAAEIVDDELRISARCTISMRCMRAHPERVISDIQETCASGDEVLKIRLVHTLADGASTAQDSAIVRALISLLANGTNVYRKLDAMTKTGMAFARIGCVDEALAVANSINELLDRQRGDRNLQIAARNGETQIKSHAAQTLARTHDFERAFEISTTLDEDSSLASNEAGLADALGAISLYAAQAGDRRWLEAAVESAQFIRSDWTKPAALSQVSRALAKIGDFSRALVIADDGFGTARSASAKNQARRAVAEEQFSRRMFVDALRTLRDIDDPEERAMALHNIATQIDKNSKRWLIPLFRIAKAITDSRFQPKAISGLGKACAHLQDYRGITRCLTMARKLENETERRDAVKGIAKALVKQKDREGVSLLMKSLEDFDSVWPRVDGLTEIAQALIALDDAKTAFELWDSELQRWESSGIDSAHAVLRGMISLLGDVNATTTLLEIRQKLLHLDSWWAAETANATEKYDAGLGH